MIEWKDIKSLLLKTNHAVSSRVFLKKAVVGAVNKSLGVTVESSSVRIKEGVAEFSVHPAIKSEIFLKKQEILNLIHQDVGVANTIHDLR